MEQQLQQYNCDSVTLTLAPDQIPIIKGWIEVRNDKISSLEKEKTDSLAQYENEKKELIKKIEDLKENLDRQVEEQTKERTTWAEKLDREVQEKVRARISLERKAAPKLDNSEVAKLDELSDRQIKEEVIKKASSFSDLTKHSDEAIDGMFELALSLPSSVKNQDNGLSSIEPNIPSTNNREELREVIDQRSKNAFKQSFTIN